MLAIAKQNIEALKAAEEQLFVAGGRSSGRSGALEPSLFTHSGRTELLYHPHLISSVLRDKIFISNEGA